MVWVGDQTVIDVADGDESTRSVRAGFDVSGLFYNIGRRLGRAAIPAIRKTKWIYDGLAGSEEEALQAESRLGTALAAPLFSLLVALGLLAATYRGACSEYPAAWIALMAAGALPFLLSGLLKRVEESRYQIHALAPMIVLCLVAAQKAPQLLLGGPVLAEFDIELPVVFQCYLAVYLGFLQILVKRMHPNTVGSAASRPAAQKGQPAPPSSRGVW